MMSHAFEMAITRGDVYLSKDKEAVAIWRNSNKSAMNNYTIWENIKFLIHFGLKKVKAITELEQSIKQWYPTNTSFYYLYIIGTSKKGRGKGLSNMLMNSILEEADNQNIPVYLETANPQNLAIYNKKSFENYKEISVSGDNPITLYLMKRESKQTQST